MSEGQRKHALWLAALLFAAGLAGLASSPRAWWAFACLATGAALSLMTSLSERRRAQQATLAAEQVARDATRAALDAERAARDAKERARVDAERLATALDAANLGTWEWHIVSNATFFSPNIDAILCRTPGSFERTFAAYMALVYPDDRAGVEQAIQTVLKEGGGYISQHRIVAPDGSLHWMESKGRLDSDEHGKPFRLAGTLVDISARLQADERNLQLQDQLRQAQKLEALGTLAGGIAHDFNNILGAIVAYTQLAQMDNPDNAELQQQLSEVMRASSRATNLVQQILSFGRRQRQERKACSLSAVFSNAVTLLRSTLPATIEIREDIAPNLPEVMADPIQIHQVLMNLCTNASHAMHGRGQLRLALSRYRLATDAASPHVELRPGSYLRLAISDDGEGMDEPVLSRIFEPFFTTKAAGGGSGLGLSVAHGIVKEHEGTITVHSELGKGTTFTVYLPALVPAQALVDDALAGVTLGHGEHVLFVDDESALCSAAKHILTRLGYQPHVFQDSEAAWQAFQAEPGKFDVLLTDLTMPQRTGLELADDVLRLRPGLPVILASGYSVTLTSNMLEERGIRELLYKPLEYRALAATLQRVLPQRLGQTA
jgi:signal transduction histidine kinase/ActR/RegA family two-component response regulator